MFPSRSADDGVVYVCNQVTVSTNNAFKIYRYASVTDPNPPIVAFSNAIAPASVTVKALTSARRTNTQIIIGSMLGTTATNVSFSRRLMGRISPPDHRYLPMSSPAGLDNSPMQHCVRPDTPSGQELTGPSAT